MPSRESSTVTPADRPNAKIAERLFEARTMLIHGEISSKLAREVLFTVVSWEEKYKAKNFIDTAVSRGDDALTGWAVSGMQALGATTAQLFWLLVPAMLLWGWIGWLLARCEASLQSQ